MRLSLRASVDLTPNDLAAARAARGSAATVDLSGSDPGRAGIPRDLEAIGRALAAGVARALPQDPRGHELAREAISALASSRGDAVPATSVQITASTSESYSLLIRLLCDPGDALLVPTPSYPLLEHLARAEGVELVPYPLGFDGEFHVDPDAVRRAAGPRTRAIVVVTPNNPTGTTVSGGELAALAGLGLPLVVDEVFWAYPLGGRDEAPPPPALDVPVFALDGLSKLAALPELKVGWIVASGPPAELGTALSALELLADTSLSVAMPQQAALPELLRLGAGPRAAIRARAELNLAAARAATRGTALTPLLPAGGWSLVLRLPAVVPGGELALELLSRDGVLVQPGWFYDLPFEALVVSLLTPPAEFAAGVAVLLRRVAERI